MQHQYTASQLQKIWNGESLIPHPEYMIQWLLIDSRKLIHPEASVFFALNGKKDSHTFIPELYKKGVRNYVISNKNIDLKSFPEANFFFVDNPLKYLQTLVSYHRNLFQFPVIGITGSNGKTVVKDWLYQLLSPEFSIVKSPKSYNSQIGVPLSVWQMTHAFQLGIFEAGISTINEMNKLRSIIDPEIGILTNIRSAHDEGFKNREEKLKEKLKLFDHSKVIVYSKDYVPEGIVKADKSFTWSYNSDADLRILKVEKTSRGSEVTAYYQYKEFTINTTLKDDASIENIIICCAVLLYLKYSIDQITERLKALQAIPMRLEMKQGINQCSIINDSYSADIASLFIAVDFMVQQKHDKKTVILSDMIHAENEPVYKMIADYLKTHQIDRVIGVGKEISSHADLFSMEKIFFPDTEACLKVLNNIEFFKEGVLVKGARSFGFERIVSSLEEKVHETVFEINLNAIVHNLNFYRSKIHKETKVMVMVKAFAYGSGTFEIANVLQYNKVDYLAVAYVDEGVALRQAGITLPIMVMSPESSSFEKLIEYNLEPELYNLRILQSFNHLLKSKSINHYPVHLKVDTGMHRLGFEEKDLPEIRKIFDDENHLKIVSVFSHLSSSDEEVHDDFTNSQLDKFNNFYSKVSVIIGHHSIRHIANTAAILRHPSAEYDMVRLGIGLYGIENVGFYQHELQRVGTLKTTVTQVREVDEKETVGYSRKGKLTRNSKIATIKIGYADGYSRAFGNGVGEMLVNGKRVKVIGNVCMDMCMLDVTGMYVNEGDEVIVFGEDPTINELASKINTIPYEILTGISQRVQRIYYYE